METESVRKAEQWANASRTQGLWSVGLLLLLFFTAFFSNIARRGSGMEFMLSCLVFLLVFANGVSSLVTCIFALIAFRGNSKDGNNATIKKTATIGLILGAIPMVALLAIILVSLFVVIW